METGSKKRLTVAVIFGGCSPEYDISLQSAECVLKNLDSCRYEAVPVGISKEGQWFWYQGDAAKIRQDAWCNEADCTPAVLSPDRRDHGLLIYRGTEIVQLHLDAAFPVLHGKNGEDGTIQGLLSLAGIPVVGCGVLASAVCMDKNRAHQLASAAGIPVPGSFICRTEDDMEEVMERAGRLGYPLFVKPVSSGSSFGITQVEAPEAIGNALDLAWKYDEEAIVEEMIQGVEVGCSVLGNRQLTVGTVDEIELKNGFLDLQQKYGERTAVIHVPARVSGEKQKEIQKTAMAVYKALGCRGFARVDLFLEPSGRLLFNEVNTIPGMTSHSRFPNMLKAAGISMTDMVSQVMELAVE